MEIHQCAKELNQLTDTLQTHKSRNFQYLWYDKYYSLKDLHMKHIFFFLIEELL